MATGNSTVLVTNFFLWSKGIYLWKLLFFTWDEKYQSIKIEFNFVGIQTVCEQTPGENGQKKKIGERGTKEWAKWLGQDMIPGTDVIERRHQ